MQWPAAYHERVGTTVGLAAQMCSRVACRAEQVYVNVDPATSHPIEVRAWVGYETIGVMRFTKSQATELIGLLAKAVGSQTQQGGGS
jgi:hypothetical protein